MSACRDDVVFHDDFLSIFPDYWASVPVNYEYIAVGMIPRHFNASEKTVYGEAEAQAHRDHSDASAHRAACQSLRSDGCTSCKYITKTVRAASRQILTDCWAVACDKMA